MRQKILLLGNPQLYEKSIEVRREELGEIKAVVGDLRDTLLAFRAEHGAGRAIAAPQIGVQKRMIYMEISGVSTVFFNPVLTFPDSEMMEVQDDCMSFPALLVRVLRYKRCTVTYRDADWVKRETKLEDDLAELLQHECDHLDGILATMRAVDNRAFCVKL